MLGLSISTFHDLLPSSSTNPSLTHLTLITFIVFIWKLHKTRSSTKVYLLDFSCYKPPAALACTKETVAARMKRYGNFSEETMSFVRTRLERSGLGQSTYLSPTLMADPVDVRLEGARKDSEMVIFGSIDDLLAKTGVEGKDIRIVILNCSLFTVLPSMSAMIVNRYKLGDDVLTYNVNGMGCSGGLIAIGLAKNLLQVHANSYALVLSTENISHNVYKGSDRSKLVSYTVFRVGAAAILLSNRPSDRRTAKYRILHTVHTNTASSDQSFNCVVHGEDSEGEVGLSITRDLMPVATQTIKKHLAALGRRILPPAEKARYVANHVARYLHVANIKPYVPDFGTAFDHVYLHVGGKSVLDGLERELRFSEEDMEASRKALSRFGNTSSSSVWYALWYDEARGKIERGDRLWLMAYGTGFKTSSVIWEAIRAVDSRETNPWMDEIHASGSE